MKKEIFDILSNLIGKWLNNIEEGCKAREKKGSDVDKFIEDGLELDKEIHKALGLSPPDEIKNPKRFL